MSVATDTPGPGRSAATANADAPRMQGGFVLLALLFAGVLGSGAWLVVQGPTGTPLRAEQAITALERSRRVLDALSAHATLYADLYGPTGAGPGHLPCPDRHQSRAGRLSPALLPRAGPDPPCAAYPAPTAALPLHVNVARLRAGIDPAAVGSPVLGYRVEAAVVNNPLGRAVNVRTMPDVLARVHADDGQRALALRSASMAPAVQRRVAAWLRERLHERGTVPECASRVPCPAMDALGTGADPTALLEGVPPSRHWFVRNGWSDDVRLHVAADCVHDLGLCGASIDQRRPLHIVWQRVPDPVTER